MPRRTRRQCGGLAVINIQSYRIVLFAGVVFACASNVSAQNMLLNPSFEQGPPIDANFLALDAGSMAMPGWIVTRGQIDIVTTAWQQVSGLRSLDLNGSPGSGGVAQTFATTPNRDYSMAFYVAGNANAAPAIKTIWVTIVGQTAGVQFDNTGTSYSNMKWTKYLYGFRATGTSATLEFYSGNPSSFGGVALDDVVVRPASCTPDLNYDAYVDDADFSVFVQAYDQFFCLGGFPGCMGDFNFDAVVDDADFVLFVAAYDQFLCS